MEDKALESVGEKLRFVLSTFCLSQQSANLSQHLTFNLYEVLYPIVGEKTLGKMLKYLRLQLGLSQYELSTLVGLSRGSIEGIEGEYNHATKDTLLKLGKVIDFKKLCCDDYSKFIINSPSYILKEWRMKNKYTIRSAASYFSIPYSTYRYWEKGQIMSKETYYKIKTKLDEIYKELNYETTINQKS